MSPLKEDDIFWAVWIELPFPDQVRHETVLSDPASFAYALPFLFEKEKCDETQVKCDVAAHSG